MINFEWLFSDLDELIDCDFDSEDNNAILREDALLNCGAKMSKEKESTHEIKGI